MSVPVHAGSAGVYVPSPYLSRATVPWAGWVYDTTVPPPLPHHDSPGSASGSESFSTTLTPTADPEWRV